MPPELQNAIPPELLAKILGSMAIGAAIVGALLWLMGSQFSRTVITLQFFTVGASLGLYAPTLFGWRVEGWMTALGGGFILGLIGFLFHRVWVAVLLAVVLAWWGAIATCGIYSSGGDWHRPNFPMISEASLRSVKTADDFLKRFPPEDFIKPVWAAIPGEVQRHLPYLCGGAAVWGLVVALLWPRIGVALLYSCLGTSLLVTAAIYARLAGYQWVNHLPTERQAQVGLLAAMVAFGAILQWWMDPLQTSRSMQPHRTADQPPQ